MKFKFDTDGRWLGNHAERTSPGSKLKHYIKGDVSSPNPISSSSSHSKSPQDPTLSNPASTSPNFVLPEQLPSKSHNEVLSRHLHRPRPRSGQRLCRTNTNHRNPSNRNLRSRQSCSRRFMPGPPSANIRSSPVPIPCRQPTRHDHRSHTRADHRL